MSCVFSKISTGKKYSPERCRSAVGGFPSGCIASAPSGSCLLECQSFNSRLTWGQFVFYEDTPSFKQQRGRNISGRKMNRAILLFLPFWPKEWKGSVSAPTLPCRALTYSCLGWGGVAQRSCLGFSGGQERPQTSFPTPRGSCRTPGAPLHSTCLQQRPRNFPRQSWKTKVLS